MTSRDPKPDAEALMPCKGHQSGSATVANGVFGLQLVFVDKLIAVDSPVTSASSTCVMAPNLWMLASKLARFASRSEVCEPKSLVAIRVQCSRYRHEAQRGAERGFFGVSPCDARKIAIAFIG